MDFIRKIERELSSNPILQKDEYPYLDDSELERLRQEASKCLPGEKFCATYVCKEVESDRIWHVDVYVIDDISIKRIVIAPGYMLQEEDEDYLSDRYFWWNVSYDKNTCVNLVEEMNQIAPELHLREYADFWRTLLHIYYACHCSGIREQLFKLGLDEIAMCAECTEYDVMGSNVNSAFGLPYNMLKKLNSRWAVLDVVCDDAQRKKAADIYKKYHTMLNKVSLLSEMQYRYLLKCYEENSTPETGMLRYLADIEDYRLHDEIDLFDEIMLYHKKREGMPECKKMFPGFPVLEDATSIVSLNDCLDEYVECKEELDCSFYAMSKVWHENYGYEDENYIICVPTHIKDLIKEAGDMRNCLYSYIKLMLNRETVVVFMREKKNRNKACVDIEIRGDIIIQANRPCNRPLKVEQKRFVEKFAAAKKLIYIT